MLSDLLTLAVSCVVLSLLGWGLAVAFRWSYNRGVVRGLSLHPETGKPRLSEVDFHSSVALVVLLFLFLAPPACLTCLPRERGGER